MKAQKSILRLALSVFLLLCGSLSSVMAATIGDGMADRMRSCAACHGQEGRATNQGYFPRIAGKPSGYLFNQLVNFRNGKRKNATMAYLVDQMSDAYLQEIADYFSSLELPYPPPPRPSEAGPNLAAALARGEQLVRQGDVARGLPACAACHGAAMTGMLPATPGLVGLPRDYILSQFGAWRNGQRHAAKPDCMRDVAERLSTEDVGAMATWLALQPVPANAKPVSQAPQALAASLASPMKCGSMVP